VEIDRVRSDVERPEHGVRKIYKLEPSLWSIIDRFTWSGLTYLKAWADLKAYFKT